VASVFLRADPRLLLLAAAIVSSSGCTDPNVVFDDQTELSASVQSIASAVNASSSNNPLYFIVAGPFEVAWQGINAATASNRQFVTIISHSNWNNDHEHVPSHHTKDELLASFPSVGYTKIPDQNGTAFKSDPAAWNWMNSAGPDLAWVRSSRSRPS
jgi:hypothetical protein